MVKLKYIYFKSILEDSRHRARRETRSVFTKCKLYLIRVIINLIVFSMLGGAGYLIYFATMKSTEVRLDTKLAMSTKRTMKINHFSNHLLFRFIVTTSQTHVQFCSVNTAWNFDSLNPKIFLWSLNIVIWDDIIIYSCSCDVRLSKYRKY